MNSRISRRRISLLIRATLLIATPGLAQSPASPTAAPPPPEAAPGQPAKAALDMQAVLDAQAALGAKPIEILTPAEARLQPSPADGVKAVMKARGMSTAPDPGITTRDLPYGTDRKQVARVYTPSRHGNSPLPVIVYYHGGGWVIADLDTYDATPRLLAQQLNAIVVSVEYRHAPEAKFPAQHEDAASAYGWVLAKAGDWGGTTDRLALAGESAGGNLAVATAIYARDHKLKLPRHILAVYPIANASKTLPSRQDSFNAKPLNTPMLDWFGYFYQKSAADGMDPRLDLVNANLRGLPSVTIVNAQIDPLRSDGTTLAAALKTAGVPVEQRTYPGVTHEFFGMGKVVAGASQAEDYAVARPRADLN